MTSDLVLFLSIAVIAVAAAGSMLLSRNTVYSALFLVLNFVAVAVLYLLLNAAFIALVQITVYAGAIMVLFLFVIMLLGAEWVEAKPSLTWQGPVAGLLALALVIELMAVALRAGGFTQVLQVVGESFGSPRAVGELLFSQYLIPFEITSVLLLVAMVGAIVIARSEREASG